MLIREKYLNEIRPFYDSNLIKILVGIRRSGKSVLLGQIKNEIKKYTSEDHIIFINFEDISFEELLDYKKLNSYVCNLIKDDDKYYLFLDEIQNVKNFEKVINSLRATKNISIFITGSNGRLLSQELSTYLSGRYVSFNIYPLSFKEITLLENKKSNKVLLDEYIKYGSLPNIFEFKDETSKKNYLYNIYDSIVLRDVISREKIRDLDLFNMILQYILDTVGKEFSSDNIIKYLKSNNRDVSTITIYSYLDALCKAFIIRKVSRYNVHGKSILKTLSKYYPTDFGIASIKRHEAFFNKTYALENVVLNELIYKGYEVFTGKTKKGEIDFVALKDNDKKYIQVSLSVQNEETREREFNAFNDIDDNYPKYVITLDEDNYQIKGIKHLNLIDFLLDENF